MIGEVDSWVAAKVINRLLGRGWELRILRGVFRWGLVGWIVFAKVIFICSCERNMCERSLWIFKQNHSRFYRHIFCITINISILRHKGANFIVSIGRRSSKNAHTAYSWCAAACFFVFFYHANIC